MELRILEKALYESYSKDLCYPKNKKLWNESNKTLGMCAITALVINDYLGGNICKIKVEEVSHYFNLINDKIIDLTSSQFKSIVDYTNYEIININNFMNEETKARYILLSDRIKKNIVKQIDDEIIECKKCVNIVEKFPATSTIYFGKDNKILLVGEAPANNGWRKSNKLWKNIDGKILPSGLILQKLFDIIEKDIFETTFLEAIKCFPVERKNLKECFKNCKEYMYRQIEVLKPNIIITLGEFPTKALLDFKFNKFSEVVGKIHSVGNYKILPIYHPSPISPKSYKGNKPIFHHLKDILKSI